MARKPTGRRVVAAVLLMMIAGLGCNPLMLPYYMFGGLKPGKVPSHFEFYDRARAAKKKKDIKIVVLAYRGQSLAPDYVGTDRTLTNMFVNALKASFAANRERVTIVPVAEVEKFMRQHDDWRGMEPGEIARQFEADYVVDMELASLSLYEPGTRHLYRGHCRIPISIKDADKDAAEIFPPHEYTKDFPGGGVILSADEMSPEQFQNQFLSKVATELAGLFTATPTAQRFR